jgi:hypothetical protein
MKLYRYWNGELETATLIKEDCAPGATVTTYVVKDKHGKCRVNKNFYCHSIEDAAKKELELYKKGLIDQEQLLVETKQQIEMIKGVITKLEKVLEK